VGSDRLSSVWVYTGSLVVIGVGLAVEYPRVMVRIRVGCWCEVIDLVQEEKERACILCFCIKSC
jgi:hypothetical protein